MADMPWEEEPEGNFEEPEGNFVPLETTERKRLLEDLEKRGVIQEELCPENQDYLNNPVLNRQYIHDLVMRYGGETLLRVPVLQTSGDEDALLFINEAYGPLLEGLKREVTEREAEARKKSMQVQPQALKPRDRSTATHWDPDFEGGQFEWFESAMEDHGYDRIPSDASQVVFRNEETKHYYLLQRNRGLVPVTEIERVARQVGIHLDGPDAPEAPAPTSRGR